MASPFPEPPKSVTVVPFVTDSALLLPEPPNKVTLVPPLAESEFAFPEPPSWMLAAVERPLLAPTIVESVVTMLVYPVPPPR